MGIFYNNYQRLRQENVDESAKLLPESREILIRMWNYINSFDVSLFELEVIKKDVIGIAKEAELEGINVKDKLGIPEKEFCDSLTKDIIKQNRAERLLLIVKNWFLWFCALYIFHFMISGFPTTFEFTTWFLFYPFIFMGVGYIIYRRILARKNFAEVLQYKRQRITANILFCIFFATIWVSLAFFDFPIIKGNGWVMLAVVCVLTAIAFFGNNIYWNKCSEMYNWE